MAIERTFSIIKPNAVKKNAIGDIIHTFESKGLKIAAAKLTMISKEKFTSLASAVVEGIFVTIVKLLLGITSRFKLS